MIFAARVYAAYAFVTVQEFDSSFLIPYFDLALIVEFDAGSFGYAYGIVVCVNADLVISPDIEPDIAFGIIEGDRLLIGSIIKIVNLYADLAWLGSVRLDVQTDDKGFAADDFSQIFFLRGSGRSGGGIGGSFLGEYLCSPEKYETGGEEKKGYQDAISFSPG